MNITGFFTAQNVTKYANAGFGIKNEKVSEFNLQPLKKDTVSFSHKADDKEIEAKKNDPVLKEAIANNDAKAIFNYFGIKCTTLEDGTYKISHYERIQGENKKIRFSEFGVDEEKLLSNVSEIEGNADFYNAQVEAVPKLRRIGGNANFMCSRIKNPENLEYIGGNVRLCMAYYITSFPKLEEIGGVGDFRRGNLCHVPNLKEVKGGIEVSTHSEQLIKHLHDKEGNFRMRITRRFPTF